MILPTGFLLAVRVIVQIRKSPLFCMKWITREHAKVDRIACPWLIKNFVDNDAEFLFVPGHKVIQVAKEQNAIPFDVPSAEFGHHGVECSFDAIIKKYHLDKKEPRIIRASKDSPWWRYPKQSINAPIRRLGCYSNRL